MSTATHATAPPATAAVPVFDGHNDTLLRLVSTGADPVAAFLHSSDPAGHLDLPSARRGGFAGGLFACFVPPEGERDAGFELTADGYAVPMPDPPGLAHARQLTDTMVACAHRLAREAPDAVRLCLDAPSIRACLRNGVLAMVLHLEGAEAIGPDLDGLDRYVQAGIRSIGPLWSRPNCFGTGVPFRYPADPDDGPGLTHAGLALVRECNRLGVMLDVSHLNAAGFFDVARTSHMPLVATHSNAHAVCPVARNLTDAQLRTIRDSGGLVGLSLAVCDLHPAGHNDPAIPLSIVLRHLDHLFGILGPDGVALGSDMDGAVLPQAIGTAAGLQVLVSALRAHGYDEALVGKLCWGNWLNVLERSWA